MTNQMGKYWRLTGNDESFKISAANFNSLKDVELSRTNMLHAQQEWYNCMFVMQEILHDKLNNTKTYCMIVMLENTIKKEK